MLCLFIVFGFHNDCLGQMTLGLVTLTGGENMVNVDAYCCHLCEEPHQPTFARSKQSCVSQIYEVLRKKNRIFGLGK